MTGLAVTSQASETTSMNSPDKIVPEQQIYGVQCRLLPDKNEWQASEIPIFKAYVPAPGNENLRLAAIVHQGCQVQVNNKWYRYINSRWTGGTSTHYSTAWLVQAGGFLRISLDKGHWVTIDDSKPLVLEADNRTISFGWAGYKEDLAGNNSPEENPVLLVSEPVQI